MAPWMLYSVTLTFVFKVKRFQGQTFSCCACAINNAHSADVLGRSASACTAPAVKLLWFSTAIDFNQFMVAVQLEPLFIICFFVTNLFRNGEFSAVFHWTINLNNFLVASYAFAFVGQRQRSLGQHQHLTVAVSYTAFSLNSFDCFTRHWSFSLNS